MTREIKFRAWDKNKKEVRKVTGINWYDEYLWVDETPMSGDRLPIEGTPLMQYTGIKDKNGKDIYEGDIVEWRDPLLKLPNQNFFIEWNKTFYRLAAREPDLSMINYYLDGARLEIIGDMFGNPEQLINK